jgi:hypothetical protein
MADIGKESRLQLVQLFRFLIQPLGFFGLLLGGHVLNRCQHIRLSANVHRIQVERNVSQIARLRPPSACEVVYEAVRHEFDAYPFPLSLGRYVQFRTGFSDDFVPRAFEEPQECIVDGG